MRNLAIFAVSAFLFADSRYPVYAHNGNSTEGRKLNELCYNNVDLYNTLFNELDVGSSTNQAFFLNSKKTLRLLNENPKENKKKRKDDKKPVENKLKQGERENDPPAPRGEGNPPAPQGEGNPPAPQGEGNPPAPQGEGNPPAPQGEGNPPAPRGEGNPPAPQGEGNPPAPQGEGNPPAPQGEGNPPAPRGEGNPPAPQGEGNPPAPQGEGNPPAPQGEGNPPAAQGEGNPPAAQGNGNPPAAQGNGNPPAAQGNGNPPAPAGKGKNENQKEKEEKNAANNPPSEDDIKKYIDKIRNDITENWSPCSVTCGFGVRVRRKAGASAKKAQELTLSDLETEICKIENCSSIFNVVSNSLGLVIFLFLVFFH
ncbi:circumsporozoite (CS) protein (CSP) [Plasmodium ovale curtisi]|uniref:Circumsporozoite protein n=2 Tax=Plasmodium ovale curtisi TaxID=864141 RepID=A0A1A8X4K9_PLAOA|nr:circumsporozoite (CS) protein (CSP) [Plasmodium ovale curtisi]